MKKTLKEALIEGLRENRELLTEVVAEAIEDVAMAKAIERGSRSKEVSRDRVLAALRGKR